MFRKTLGLIQRPTKRARRALPHLFVIVITVLMLVADSLTLNRTPGVDHGCANDDGSLL
jgi:hypothetical protein